MEPLDLNDPNLVKAIWKPEVYFPNAKDAEFQYVTVPNVLVRIDPGGQILYMLRYVILNLLLWSSINDVASFTSILTPPSPPNVTNILHLAKEMHFSSIFEHFPQKYSRLYFCLPPRKWLRHLWTVPFVVKLHFKMAIFVLNLPSYLLSVNFSSCQRNLIKTCQI